MQACVKQFGCCHCPVTLKLIVGTFVFSVGIVSVRYDSTFKSNHRLCMSILKQFGFGQRVMETRILMEVEEMINKVREQQGRPFDVKQLTTSCVANVIMSVLFGRRFDHSDPAFRQLVCDMEDGNDNFSMELQLFHALRFLPHYRKVAAKEIKTIKRVFEFIRNNIAACTKVCNCITVIIIIIIIIIFVYL